MTAILLALAAAAVMGWASVAQQHVASSVPVHEGGALHLLLQLLRQPLWLAAFATNLVGFALHSWALDLGSLLSPKRRDKALEDLTGGHPTWPWAWLAETADPFTFGRLQNDLRQVRAGADATPLLAELADQP